MKSQNNLITVEPESSILEYKENINTKTYLKTITAYANYCDGEIKFGITDGKEIVGIDNPEQAALDIENQINDNIHPQPRYSISIDTNSRIITVFVQKGKNTPYRYKGKAYRRNGSSTIEVDDYELNQLILMGKNLEYCDLLSTKQNLTFNGFSVFWNKIYTLAVNEDLLATLGSYNSEGYSNTAQLLSDQNEFPGVSVVLFGESISQIEKKHKFEEMSILKIYEETLNYITNIISYEDISGIYRELKNKVPIIALRETLVNAIVHRDWSIPAPVQIEIFPDKLTIMSPGGLPNSMSEEEYLNSNRSIPRNTQLTIIFLRLNLIEKLGTGLRRVRNSYATSGFKPKFKVYPNSIYVELPFINREIKLNEEQKKIVGILEEKGPVKRKVLEKTLGLSQSKTTRILNELINKGVVEKINSGPRTEYKVS